MQVRSAPVCNNGNQNVLHAGRIAKDFVDIVFALVAEVHVANYVVEEEVHGFLNSSGFLVLLNL